MTKLPTGWYEEPLNKFVDARSGNGKLIKGKQSVTKSEGLFPAFSASGQDIWTEKAEVSGPGIVVSAVGARCGKSFLTDGNWTAVANTHILQIKKDAQLDIKYLWYLCNDENWWIRSGTAQPFVKVKDTLERPQLLPPIHVQYKIVEILEDHLSRLDAALADVKQAKIKAAQFRRSLLQAAFTGDLNGDGTRLMVELPVGWEVKRLGDCLEQLKSGKKAERGWSPQCLSNPSPDENVWGVLKTTAVQMGRYEPEHNKQLPETLKPKVRLEVIAGDFLVTTTGPRNRCGVVCHVRETRKKLIFSGKILRFRADEDIVLSNWLMYLLMSPDYQATFDELKVGTSDSSVSIGNQQILDLQIPVPPLAEQQQIVEILESSLSRLDASVAIADEMEKHSSSLRRSLLQAAFTGQLTKEVANV